MSVFPITALGETERVFGLTFGDIFLKGRRRLFFAPFGFDGDNLYPVLQDEIQLVVLAGEVSRLDVKLTAKLLQKVVFRQRALELIVGLQEDGAVIDAGHVFQKARVEEKELELV